MVFKIKYRGGSDLAMYSIRRKRLHFKIRADRILTPICNSCFTRHHVAETVGKHLQHGTIVFFVNSGNNIAHF